jgi:ABC-2 type transport system permease protein
MSKLWLVAQHEYRRHVLKRSFLVIALSVPVLIAAAIGITFVTRALRDDSTARVGYVDQAGLLAEPLPVGNEAEAAVRWIPFQTESAAQVALEAKEIEAYYVLPAGDSGGTRRVELVYVEEPGREIVRQFRDLLRMNLLSGQPAEIAHRAIDGSILVVRSPGAAPGSVREFSGSPTLGQLLPALSGFALVILIFVSSGYLMGAVTDEKSNRTMEILMTSISPNALMTGKVLGITAIAATQLVVWILLASLLVFVGGNVLGLEWLQDICDPHDRLDLPTFLTLLLVLVPSYVLVAALMTALGATWVEAHASQQVTTMLLTFYMTPMLFVVPMMRNLNSPLTTGLSLFPLTAPVVLPLRATFVQVPFWQIAASVVIQGACALGALWLAGRAFRLGMLRYGRRLRLGELLGGRTIQPLTRSRRSTRGLGVRGGDEVTSRAPAGNKALLVLRHELIAIATKPLFLLVCIGLPLFVFVQLVVMEAAFNDKPLIHSGLGDVSGVASTLAGPESEVQGYVDRSGLIQIPPDQLPAPWTTDIRPRPGGGGTLVPYIDEAAARQALADGEIAAFYVIPADYVDSGKLICVRPDYSPFAPDDPSAQVNWVLLANLLEGDTALAAQVWNPMELQASAWTPALSPGGQPDGAHPKLPHPHTPTPPHPRTPTLTEEGDGIARLIPMMIALLLYGVIVMASGLLMQSVSNEKKNRVIEILLLSLSPRQMLTGKIVALGIAGLSQAVVWGGLGGVFFALAGRTLNLPAGIELSPSLLIWGVVFFLLGYALYASLMAGAGALVPDVKKAPQVSFMFYLPALVGFEIGLFTVENPHGPLATGVSLFPLTAPFTMMNRLVIGGVPLWQPLLAAVLMAATIPLFVGAVARMFRAQNLLSGQPFTFKRYWRALLGR